MSAFSGHSKAVVLLSGGLDSATALAVALHEGHTCTALSFDYGQRHFRELESAKALVRHFGIQQEIVSFKMPWGGSALLNPQMPLPFDRPGSVLSSEIPATYVPARNMIFLSFAASLAEVMEARAIFIGVNALDYSGYPDCREPFIRTLQEAMMTGTKAGVEGHAPKIETPLIEMTKKDIILLGHKLNVPFEKTWSCYAGGETPCGHCDSCLLRAKGFAEAGLKDPQIQS